ncbi:uncharacterized protein LOC133200392 [Saccostrea echinata]|uniref:uncharacterized protein LOC133200392 n=1 Tax=Saccostrea echinata TaxID=191078 RepID=UPI002A7FD6A1|nr:uncharacterized protein LOC133200392 [Saccostrea echinata]
MDINYSHTPVTMESLERQRAMAMPRCNTPSEAPPLPVGKEYHAYFSFHGENPDYNWVKAVTRELESRGFKCCVFPRDLDAGRSLSYNIKHILTKCLRIVTVLSSAYIKNEWSQLEMEIISLGKLDELVFIPVLIEPCDIPPFLKYYRYVNATTAKETWWNMFYEQVRGNAPRLPPRKKFHAYFAHTSSDTQWVTNIVERLESPHNNIICCYPARDFKPGTSINESIDTAIKKSVKVVLVLSKNFLLNEWKRYYEKKFKHLKAIPIIISDCGLPIALDDIVCIDARNTETDWYKVLLRAINEEDLSADDDTVTSTSQFIRDEVIYTPAAGPSFGLPTSTAL